MLLAGGNYDGETLSSVEALHVTNGSKICDLPNMTSGKDTLSGLTACGGYFIKDKDNCITLANGQWTQCHTLTRPRSGHNSVSIEDQVFLIGGSDEESLNTTEILTLGSSTTTNGFELKYPTKYDNDMINFKSPTLHISY